MYSRNKKDYPNTAAYIAAGRVYAAAHFQMGDRVRMVAIDEEPASTLFGVNQNDLGTIVENYDDFVAALNGKPLTGNVLDRDGDMAVKFDSVGIAHVSPLSVDRETQ